MYPCATEPAQRADSLAVSVGAVAFALLLIVLLRGAFVPCQSKVGQLGTLTAVPLRHRSVRPSAEARGRSPRCAGRSRRGHLSCLGGRRSVRGELTSTGG
jgi:hypothetical protein